MQKTANALFNLDAQTMTWPVQSLWFSLTVEDHNTENIHGACAKVGQIPPHWVERKTVNRKVKKKPKRRCNPTHAECINYLVWSLQQQLSIQAQIRKHQELAHVFYHDWWSCYTSWRFSQKSSRSCSRTFAPAVGMQRVAAESAIWPLQIDTKHDSCED